MKKIKLFSTTKKDKIEGYDANLYIKFYLVFSKSYVFTFLIDTANFSCSDRHPIRLWKHFLIEQEKDKVKYYRRYENMCIDRRQKNDI